MAGAFPLLAAQYLRMSTEHQNYSLSHQSAGIAAYAASHGYQIVRTYQDPATSGLRLENREGLKALLSDVLGAVGGVAAVLVYDVSRWGRFQDLDESAHYEFLCRQAGVQIIYCAEPFDPDGGIISHIVKQLKRAMAAEYSRELSTKVSEAKRGLSARGFWTGGKCCYGFRRAVVNAEGSVVRILQDGERKALQGQRVVLMEGPAEEVAVVRRIFRDFVIGGLGTVGITNRLAAEGLTANHGRPWSRGKVRRLLCNELYAGVLVTGRRRASLRKVRDAPAQEWRRLPGGCPTLVERWLFDLAQKNLKVARPLGTDEEMLEDLRRIIVDHGRVSATLIRAHGVHDPWSYAQRFGSLGAAYARIDYTPGRRQASALRRRRLAAAGAAPSSISDEELLARLQALYARTGRLTCTQIDEAPDLPASTLVKRRLGSMTTVWGLVGCTPTQRQAQAAKYAARRAAGGALAPFLVTRPTPA